MDITSSLKGFAFKTFIIFLSLCTLVWFSIISYSLLYYLYIPAVAHIRPVHLQYDMSCFKGKQCHPKFPFDNVTLIEENNEFLRGGQAYAVELVLEMPESERNWIQGIFMIKLDMINCEGRLMKSTKRAAMLRYRSPLFKIIYTLFFLPGLLAGSFEEKQSLVVPLFEEYVENSYSSSCFAHVEIQAQTAEIYSSSLRIHAKFTGLRYLMYYWPMTSAIIGIGGNFLFLVATIALIWFYESTKAESTMEDVQLTQSNLVEHQIREKNTCESAGDRTETDLLGSEENIESNPTHDNGFEVPEGERRIGIERENIQIENLPRHRSLFTSEDIYDIH